MGDRANGPIEHRTVRDEALNTCVGVACRGGRGGERQIAVVLDASPATQVWPLVTAAHQLSPRESDVTLLVARGLSTSEIGQSLRFTEHTVQEHLKVSSTSSASAAAVS